MGNDPLDDVVGEGAVALAVHKVVAEGVDLESDSDSELMVELELAEDEDAEEEEQKQTPIPKVKSAILFCVTFTDGVASSVVIPWVPFMVMQEFGFEEADVGYVAGFITSILHVTALFSMSILSYFSDVYGRRPIMMLGLLANLVFIILFGISKHLWQALLFRGLNGAFNANVGLVKTYIREITDGTNQARVFTIRTCGYALGFLVGPTMGGFLAPVRAPFDKMALFATFPFLLPCLIVAIFNGCTLIAAYFWLPETLYRFQTKEDSHELELGTVNKNKRGWQPIQASMASASDSTSSHSAYSRRSASSSSSSIGNGEGLSLESELVTLNKESIGSDSIGKGGEEGKRRRRVKRERVRRIGGERKGAGEDGVALLNQSDNQSASPSEVVPPPALITPMSYVTNLFTVMKRKEVLQAMTCYMCVGFNQLSYYEMFAVWAIRSHENGGLAFESHHLGIVQAVGGVSMLLTNIFLFHRMERRFGSQAVLIASSGLMALLFFISPYLTLFNSNFTVVMVMACVQYSLVYSILTVAFACVSLLINNVSTPETAASVNGASASSVSFSRLLAPIAGGSLLAFFANSSFPFPFDYHFPFLLLVVTVGAQVLLAWFMPASVNERLS
eukprot:TRINITY_DN13018_c0_g1_i1.p1 TRINITY_DN13018_c0_g1~~TRINITY_DN13018_c0_g1_i1.p1  ORF type:complete len:618 (-),score=82.07 TRINITY_DN13018_c0_g1_i1:171-2024(-)